MAFESESNGSNSVPSLTSCVTLSMLLNLSEPPVLLIIWGIFNTYHKVDYKD